MKPGRADPIGRGRWTLSQRFLEGIQLDVEDVRILFNSASILGLQRAESCQSVSLRTLSSMPCHAMGGRQDKEPGP